MLVSSYNNQAFEDLLMIQLDRSKVEEQNFERKSDITRLFNKKTDETVGFNFFKVSKWLDLKESGPVTLSESDVKQLNQALKEAGFKAELTADSSPKFVVGHVQEAKAMEGSDHLFITQTEVDNGEVLQIVCGASNVAAGQKVVVAKPGAIMPDGMVVWPGKLRGTKSTGMISSAKELNIDVPAEKQEGILVLDDDYEVGRAFEI